MNAKVQSSNKETLEARLAECRRQEADVDGQIRTHTAEASDLQETLAVKAAVQRTMGREVESFRQRQRPAIRHGISYNQDARLARLEAEESGHGAARGASSASQLNGIWSYAQEELRLARSSETYSAPAPERDGARPYARYFRIGQLILGFLTEDGRQAAVWSAGAGTPGWVSVEEPREVDELRKAVAILDRRGGCPTRR